MHTDHIVSIRVNGEPRRVAAGLSLSQLAVELGLAAEKIAVERNLEIVPRSTLAQGPCRGWRRARRLCILSAAAIADMFARLMRDTWTVAGRTFRSRLIVGTGKYKDYAQNAAAVAASGAEIVTVAVRRINVSDPSQPMLTEFYRSQEDHLPAQHRRLFRR